MTGRPILLTLYAAAMGAFEPFAPALLRQRAARGKEDPVRMRERLGHAGVARPEGPLVWLHGVSVGESLSLLPLIDRIRKERPGLAILVTSGTVTSATLLSHRLPPGVIHQYAPVDGPKAVRRFLDHWRPDLALFAESELWPNLILGARDRGVKLALLSARITARTAASWAKRPAAVAALLGAFEVILPQDDGSAQRLTTLGAPPGPELNLKVVGDPLPCDEVELQRLRDRLFGRRIVVAASTHPGEDLLIAKATPADALLIVVPRHPERGREIIADLDSLGWSTALRSASDPIERKTDIYVADTLGEMGLFLRLADVVVMGGSFLPGIGGHNPLEPARLGRAVVSGPYSYNFEDIYAGMAAALAVRIVDEDALGSEIAAMLRDSAATKTLAEAASAYAAGQRQAFEEGWGLVRKLLP